MRQNLYDERIERFLLQRCQRFQPGVYLFVKIFHQEVFAPWAPIASHFSPPAIAPSIKSTQAFPIFLFLTVNSVIFVTHLLFTK
jgi:hypothetical protein